MSDCDCDLVCSERALRASDGRTLHVYQWIPRTGDERCGVVVALMHGYGEHAGRYREFAEFLVRAGHVVHGLDARGHGQSGGQRGDVPDFARYVQDYFDFVQALKQRYPSRPLVMLGHSQGGLIALRTVQSRPPLADGLIVSCPLVALQPAHRPLPLWCAAILARVAGRLPLPNGIDARELTHDALKLEQHARDQLNHKWSSPRWYVSLHAAMSQVFANLDAVRLPVLVLSADQDPIVVPSAVQRVFHGVASSDKELLIVKGALHEILNEVGREGTYQHIAAWLATRWKSSAAA